MPEQESTTCYVVQHRTRPRVTTPWSRWGLVKDYPEQFGDLATALADRLRANGHKDLDEVRVLKVTQEVVY